MEINLVFFVVKAQAYVSVFFGATSKGGRGCDFRKGEEKRDQDFGGYFCTYFQHFLGEPQRHVESWGGQKLLPLGGSQCILCVFLCSR